MKSMISHKASSISCIVATRNTATVLPGLLESLACQTARGFEVIVQDGASTDETLAILEQWRDRLPELSVQSAPDNGIYDAWNRALPRARGQWILFLGADDALLHSQSLKKILPRLLAQPKDVLYVATPVVVVPQGGAERHSAGDSTLWPSAQPEKDLPQGMVLPHQGLFHRRSLFSAEHFDERYRIAGDYDFLARTFQQGRVIIWNEPVVCMSAGGVSSQLDGMWKTEWEQLKISRHYFPHALPWKICARLMRSLVCAALVALLGSGCAAAFANTLRRLRGKPSLWQG